MLLDTAQIYVDTEPGRVHIPTTVAGNLRVKAGLPGTFIDLGDVRGPLNLGGFGLNGYGVLEGKVIRARVRTPLDTAVYAKRLKDCVLILDVDGAAKNGIMLVDCENVEVYARVSNVGGVSIGTGYAINIQGSRNIKIRDFYPRNVRYGVTFQGQNYDCEVDGCMVTGPNVAADVDKHSGSIFGLKLSRVPTYKDFNETHGGVQTVALYTDGHTYVARSIPDLPAMRQILASRTVTEAGI